MRTTFLDRKSTAPGKNPSTEVPTVETFRTNFGWIALAQRDAAVIRLAFGHRTEASALKRLIRCLGADYLISKIDPTIKERLICYTEGTYDHFDGISISTDHLTRFQKRVIERCRQIPFGKLITYGELARKVGSPGAARAVGQVMATNRIPLIVPCHRVVRAGGGLGGFSAPQGVGMKERLLAHEQACLVDQTDSV